MNKYNIPFSTCKSIVDEFFIFGILTDFIGWLVKKEFLLDYIIQIRCSTSMVHVQIELNYSK